MKKIFGLLLIIIIVLSAATAVFASPADIIYVTETVGSGDEIVVNLKNLDENISWKQDFKVSSDFTSGRKGYQGAGFIESVEVTRENKLVLKLKDTYTLTEERNLLGEVILTAREDADLYYVVDFDISLHNKVVFVYGEKNMKSADIQYLVPAENTVFVCDVDEPGYAAFFVEQLTGYVNMESDERIYLDVVVDDTDVSDQLYEYLGEESYEENISETYTFVGRPEFFNPVRLSVIADYRNACYLYNWDGYKLTAIEAEYDTIEGKLWWEDREPQTIVVSKTDLFVPAQSEDDFNPSKNPHTGAANAAAGEIGLAGLLIICGTAAWSKRQKK